MTFKTHMVLVADIDGFKTLCGISSDGCSEDFFDAMPLVAYSDKKGTTCKKCLKKWPLEEAKFEGMILQDESLL